MGLWVPLIISIINYHLKGPPSFEPPHLKIALDFGFDFAIAFESSLAILTSNPLQMSTSLSSSNSRFISDFDSNFYLEFAFDLEGRNCTHWHVARAHSHARALARTRSPESAGHAPPGAPHQIVRRTREAAGCP